MTCNDNEQVPDELPELDHTTADDIRDIVNDLPFDIPHDDIPWDDSATWEFV